MAKRIIIVDDEKDIRAILRHAIEATRDWIVLEAENGAHGLELIRSEIPDAVLLDVMMPKMDGREVFRSLLQSEDTASIPIIFITASLQKRDIIALQALGPIAILPKPFDPIEIVNTISKLLKWDSD
jgi:CheY-like chemotaxis protein